MCLSKYNELPLSISNFSIFISNQIVKINMQKQANLKLVSIVDEINSYNENKKTILKYDNDELKKKENSDLDLSKYFNQSQTMFSQFNKFIHFFLIKKQVKTNQQIFNISMSEYNKDAPIHNDFVYRTDSYIKSFLTNVFLFLQTIMRGLVTKCSLARKYGIKKISKPNYHFFLGRISRIKYKELMNCTVYYLFTNTPSDGKISRQEKNKIILNKILNVQIEKTQSKNEDYKNNLKEYIPLIRYFMTLTLKEIIESYYYDSLTFYEFKNNITNRKKDLFFKKQKGFSLLKKFGLLKYAQLKSYKSNKGKVSKDD
jgi:hypothetical protein